VSRVGEAKAHLIHIGLPKTGSTYLQRWFAQHPQMAFRHGGIAGFGDVDEMAREAASPHPARVRVTSSELLGVAYSRSGLAPDHALEGTVDHDGQARVCALLASLFPTAHVLLVTRGFRAMLLSAYSEHVRQGGPSDFWERLPEPGDAQANVWKYDALVALYRRAFGDRLIVLPYELLRDRPERFLREIESRLGVEHFPPLAETLNASLSPAELRWYPRLSRLVRRLPIGDRLRRRLFASYVPRIGGRRLGRLVAFLQRLRPAPPLSPGAEWDEALARRVRGMANALCEEPLYAPYAADYFGVCPLRTCGADKSM
jgi:Sulfotransferase family